jgi:hypothetical protein
LWYIRNNIILIFTVLVLLSDGGGVRYTVMFAWKSNITYFSIIFNTLHNYNYQGERTQGERTRIRTLPCLTFSLYEKLLECASDNDLLLCRKSTSNKTRYRQWFDQCIISKMILKSGSNWLFPVVFSVEITLSGSHSGNSFEFYPT